MGILSTNTLITPFQFSSRQMQAATMLGQNLEENMATDTLLSMIAWYEMWVNPESVNMSSTYINSKQHTAGSIVTGHFRKDTTVMSVSGSVGYVAVQSRLEELQTSAIQNLIDPTKIKKTMTDLPKYGKNLVSQSKDLLDDALGFRTGNRNRLNNSPRLFLKRLRELADQKMYYIDKNGIEHYNTKYIKVFTKQYPDGVICEGYFTSFTVPESSDDPMTVPYSFEFVIENLKPITFVQRMAGMFAGTGSVAGDIARTMSGS